MTFKILSVIISINVLSNAQFLLGHNPCESKQTCGSCLQTDTCAWCRQPFFISRNGSPLPRCKQEEFFQVELRSQCSFHHVVKPNNECHCENAGNIGYEENSPLCSGVGTNKCGICECPPDFWGSFGRCECSAEDLPFHGEAGCRPDDTTSTLCNNRGDCVCGKCECYQRDNYYEDVSGQYCECRASNETCINPWPYGENIDKLCSGHGTCQCGECKCDGWYTGKYCEDCPNCPGKCEVLKPCVQCQVFGTGELFDQVEEVGVDKCSKCPFHSMIAEKAEEYVNNDEMLCTFFDDDNCRFTFAYGYKDETGELQVRVHEKDCPARKVGIRNSNTTPEVSDNGIGDITVVIIVLAIGVFVAIATISLL